MKLFNLHILKQKTLDGQLVEARKKAIVIPNKIISRLLWQIYSPQRDSLIQAYEKSKLKLREAVQPFLQNA